MDFGRTIATPSLVALILTVGVGAVHAESRENGPPQGKYLGLQLTDAQPGGPLSKFEARRIRHRCQDRANASGEPDRATALKHCYQLNIAARRFLSECKRSFGGKSDARSREEIRECVADKLRQGDSQDARGRKK